MIVKSYPNGVDCVWLAVDMRGNLGGFITAGAGPIPEVALGSDLISIEDIEGEICQLPVVSSTQLLVSVKRPDDYNSLAKRGVFVYDWLDVHRTTREAVQAYELVAVPSEPIDLDVLPSNLYSIAVSLRIPSVTFAESKVLDIRALLRCVEAE